MSSDVSTLPTHLYDLALFAYTAKVAQIFINSIYPKVILLTPALKQKIYVPYLLNLSSLYDTANAGTCDAFETSRLAGHTKIGFKKIIIKQMNRDAISPYCFK